ncbi:MAG: selenium-dependent xanthine dehydrogenase [Bacteroidales bacterium]|nr:selenium-dependent xanthine dehydrogenase [Bacteroidales bacterium]
MTVFYLNGKEKSYRGDPDKNLLEYLRNEERITSVKDGCSGQGVCGACTVEVDGKAKLSCRIKMKDIAGAMVVTMEGLPENVRTAIARAFVEKGAVQCGFCTPGMIMRVKKLYERDALPTRDEIKNTIQPNLCRCTGYIKIIEAVELACRQKNVKSGNDPAVSAAGIGSPFPKYQAFETATGTRSFVNDLHFDGMLYGALRFCDHPRAEVLETDISEALKIPGVIRIFTAADIPGKRHNGLIFDDWPLMLAKGETSGCISDVIAGVVALDENTARKAAGEIRVSYKVLEPVTQIPQALDPDSPQVHPGKSNVLEECIVKTGDADKAFAGAAYFSEGIFETPRIEHAFLETEAAVALPEGRGIKLYSQGQGVYVDRRQVAAILNLPEHEVTVIQVQNGGGFGGKEDLTVQGHASLFAFLLQKPVMLHLSREESVRMHPKRHPVIMEMKLACDAGGKLTALRLRAAGDTGAYASVGTKVMERIAGHATGGYTVPNVDISTLTVYTHNIPCGAMRGFGVPQVTFALESCIDDLCRQGGFDRWQFRFDNALEEGSRTCTGQKLSGVGLKKTLLAVKNDFCNAKYAGIACGLKNTGVGNGMTDESPVIIHVVSEKKVIVHHGWSEMGQGVHNMAIQTLHGETGIDPAIIEVRVDTAANIPTGMTTSSRATALVANAIILAAEALKNDLKAQPLSSLAGKRYRGRFICDWTTKPGSGRTDPVIHFAYGFATQVVILDESGKISKVTAAHDAGKIMNQMLFEGQIQGAVHMGLGYALTENFPVENGFPLRFNLKDCGVLRVKEMPEVEVIGIEEPDPVGPYGAKGIGEIGLVPTAAAVANAFTAYDGIRRFKLPLLKKNN